MCSSTWTWHSSRQVITSKKWQRERSNKSPNKMSKLNMNWAHNHTIEKDQQQQYNLNIHQAEALVNIFSYWSPHLNSSTWSYKTINKSGRDQQGVFHNKGSIYTAGNVVQHELDIQAKARSGKKQRKLNMHHIEGCSHYTWLWWKHFRDLLLIMNLTQLQTRVHMHERCDGHVFFVIVGLWSCWKIISYHSGTINARLSKQWIS